MIAMPNVRVLRKRRAETMPEAKALTPVRLSQERPATFVLAINLKTAKALSLFLPASLVARAELVIE